MAGNNSQNSEQSPVKPLGVLATMRNKMRVKHMSLYTEKTYIAWVRQFLTFHNTKRPIDLGEAEISQFLTILAVKRQVAASTQNQALNAIVFLFKEVLHKDLGQFKEIVWAKRPQHLPVVLSRNEVRLVLANLKGVQWLIGGLLYGSGMRLTEALSLRIKDIDFERNMIIVRDAKGSKDRAVPFPKLLRTAIQEQMEKARALHTQDLKEGFGQVSLPYALQRKYPNADRSWPWQYVFPSIKRSRDPYSGQIKRHHLYHSIMEESVRSAVKKAGISKKVTCHTFRHYAESLIMPSIARFACNI